MMAFDEGVELHLVGNFILPTAQFYLTRVLKGVLQKSIPTQIRQLILYISDNKG